MEGVMRSDGLMALVGRQSFFVIITDCTVKIASDNGMAGELLDTVCARAYYLQQRH